MLFFYKRKPRRFHHEYIYVDERKEFIEKLKEKYIQHKLCSKDNNINSSLYRRERIKERVREEFNNNYQRVKRRNYFNIIPLGLIGLILIALLGAVYICFYRYFL